MNLLDLFENTNQLSRIKFRGTDHDIGEERYVFAVDGNPLVFNFSSDEDNPNPDSPSFEEILARVQRDGAMEHLRVTPAEQQAMAKKIAVERQRYLDQRQQGVAEGHADQQKMIVKRNGQPVGEVGIDRESSPGAGMYYMKHYASGLDLGGYDSREEAMDELRYAVKQGVSEAMKPSDIPPSMRDRLTMRDIEAERPQGAFRFRVTYPDGSHRDFMDFEAARSSADTEKGRMSRLGEDKKIASTGRTERVLKQLRAQYPEAANDMEALLLAFRSGQLQDRRDINRLDTELDSEEAAIDRLEAEIERIKKRRMASESLRDGEYHVAMVTLDDGSVKRVHVTQDEGFREMIEKYFAQRGRKVKDVKMDYAVQTEAAKKKPQPTNPELWGRAKSAARSKFDVYPSAYANAWAAKWYKQHGGGWRMGKPKKKD